MSRQNHYRPYNKQFQHPQQQYFHQNHQPSPSFSYQNKQYFKENDKNRLAELTNTINSLPPLMPVRLYIQNIPDYADEFDFRTHCPGLLNVVWNNNRAGCCFILVEEKQNAFDVLSLESKFPKYCREGKMFVSRADGNHIRQKMRGNRERFSKYYDLEDEYEYDKEKTGFYLKDENSNRTYFWYTKEKGFYDEYGIYYNSDGIPTRPKYIAGKEPAQQRGDGDRKFEKKEEQEEFKSSNEAFSYETDDKLMNKQNKVTQNWQEKPQQQGIQQNKDNKEEIKEDFNNNNNHNNKISNNNINSKEDNKYYNNNNGNGNNNNFNQNPYKRQNYQDKKHFQYKNNRNQPNDDGAYHQTYDPFQNKEYTPNQYKVVFQKKKLEGQSQPNSKNDQQQPNNGLNQQGQRNNYPEYEGTKDNSDNSKKNKKNYSNGGGQFQSKQQ